MAPCLGTISRIVRSNKHTKVIVVVDNIIPHEKRIGDDLLNSYFINSVDGFITMSDSVMDDLSLFNKTKERILGVHPLYDNFGQPKSKSEALEDLGLDSNFKYMLFFGVIREYKGLDILLNTLAILKTKNVKLIIAGEFYESSDPYYEIIDKHGLRDDIVLATKFIPNEEVVNYFCAADIIVQPYKNATQSGVTQIAYHFEKPMLVTNVGGLEEIVPHDKVGYVCEPEPNNIANAIDDFYYNNKESKYIKGVKNQQKIFIYTSRICTWISYVE